MSSNQRTKRENLMAAMASVTPESVDGSMYSDKNLDEMFLSVLEQLHVDSDSKARSLKYESREKKWQIIQTHMALQSDGSVVLAAGEKQIAFLNSIVVDNPDIRTIIQIKEILHDGNLIAYNTFIQARGIKIFEKCIEKRLKVINASTMSLLDASILLEIIKCFKLVINTSEGMMEFTSTFGLIEKVTQCIRFECKPLVIEVHIYILIFCYEFLIHIQL